MLGDPYEYPKFDVEMSLKKLFENAVEQGFLKATPRSGKCMICGNKLTENDEDGSVCNSCWQATFTCKICGDDQGECEHR